MDGTPLLAGPVKLEVGFYFPRPKNHFRTGKHAGVVKDGAPLFHTAKPDVDKLVRAIGDSLTGVVVRDDSQFAIVHARKRYGLPCAVITVIALSDTPHPLSERTSA